MHPDRIEPGPGQESVWDYPRPPRAEPTTARVSVEFAGAVVAATQRAIRVLETSQAPAYYFPPEDVDGSLLVPSPRRTWCEWKGQAAYVDLVVGERRSAGAAWRYDDPVPAFEVIRGYYAFYPQRVDRCTVDGEVVAPNDGDFYGGWITSRVVGPFKGATGTRHW